MPEVIESYPRLAARAMRASQRVGERLVVSEWSDRLVDTSLFVARMRQVDNRYVHELDVPDLVNGVMTCDTETVFLDLEWSMLIEEAKRFAA